MKLVVIAHAQTEFKQKFGIPRQSGLVDTVARIVFEPAFRNPDALRGIEGFSHLWLLWGFSACHETSWHATVRPPRLGGNVNMGVFATRSPYRPNPVGLSCVKLLGVEDGCLLVQGADLLDGTPIYDIKPYLPYTDSRPDAVGGFADEKLSYSLQVDFPEELLSQVPKHLQKAAVQLLSQDPRPSYQDDETRIYGVTLGKQDIRFTVAGDTLTVLEIQNVDI